MIKLIILFYWKLLRDVENVIIIQPIEECIMNYIFNGFDSHMLPKVSFCIFY